MPTRAAKTAKKSAPKTSPRKAAKTTAKKAAKTPLKKLAKKPAAPVKKKTSAKAATAALKKKPAAKKVAEAASKKPAAKKVVTKTTASRANAKAVKPVKKALKASAAKKSVKATSRAASTPATAAETTKVMNELLEHATPMSAEPAPQHAAAAATLVTSDDDSPLASNELGAAVSSTGVDAESDTDEFDASGDAGDDDERDDNAFNDAFDGATVGADAAEAPARRTYSDDGSPFPVQIARLLHDDKCTDIVVLNLKGVNPMWDYVIIGSGTSDRQMRSVLTHVCELGRTLGHEVFRRNSDERATWLLADFSDVIVHLFEPNTRAHYDLEMLWGDAERVAWERPEEMPRNRAGLQAGDGL
ncbi:MAG: ribosome silencing factor [Planctomycetota bacterium]|nr:ribosome silencing factor [Planctomycetota bacterium]